MFVVFGLSNHPTPLSSLGKIFQHDSLDASLWLRVPWQGCGYKKLCNLAAETFFKRWNDVCHTISPGNKIDAKKILLAAGMEKTGMIQQGRKHKLCLFFPFKMDILKLKTRGFWCQFLGFSLAFGIKKAAPFQWEVLDRLRSSLVHGLASSLLRTQCTPRGAKFQSLEAKENVLLCFFFHFFDFE